MRRRAVHLAGALVVSASLGLGAAAISSGAGAHGNSARATLRSIDGTRVGRVTFSSTRHHTWVRVHLDNAPGVVDAFHGFHIHANDLAAFGVGCDASNNFMSADGHWRVGTEVHGHHLGDMPSVYVNGDGSVDARFTLDRVVALRDLRGRAVILHADADNFGNVPVGGLPTQYMPNSPDAVTATETTGNAGARVACGVIR
jgi:superoxide dismutase, Cu-Zn family